MAITKKGKNSYQGYVTTYTNGKRKRLYKSFPTRKEAQMWESKMRLDDGQITASSITFKELVDIYINRKKDSVLPETLDAIEYKANQFMSTLMSKKLDSITPIMLEQWRNKLASTTYSPKYKNEIIHQLKSIFGLAHKLFYVNDPSLNVEVVKKDSSLYDDDEDSDVKTISSEEFSKMYNDLPELSDNDRYFKALIMAVWSTGMRRGEVKGIQFKDFQNGIFSINKAVTGKTKGDRTKIGSTKTRSSVRRVNVTSYCEEELSRLLSFVNDEYGYNDNWFMFGGVKPLPNSTIQERFRKGISEAQIPEIRLHDLRHSHATILLNNGVPISAVSQRLGHSSINMTLKVYAHATKDAVNALLTELPNLDKWRLTGDIEKSNIKKALN